MHPLFAEWYRVAGIDPKGVELDKRWAGVEAASAWLDKAKAVDIARLFLGSTTVTTDFKEQFSTIFQKIDPAFRMRDNDLELRVLAGATVVKQLEQPTELGTALALAVVTGASPSLRPNVLLPEIINLVDSYLFKEGQRIRGYSTVGPIKWESFKGETNTLDVIGTALTSTHNKVGTLAKSANEALARSDRQIRALIEQTNILWWVFAGTSEDLKRPYSNIELQQAAGFVAGKELANLVELLPGPIAAPAFLDKVLTTGRASTNNGTFEAAVTATDPNWKRTCIDGIDSRLDELTPIHLAFRQSVDGTAWIRAFETASGIKTKKISPSAQGLAVQIYNERLLQKAFRT